MQQFFFMIWETFLSILETSDIRDVIDIAIVTFLIYKGIKLVREIRAGQLIKGIFIMAAVYFIASIFEFKALSYIMKILFDLGAVAIIVVFQPELRRLLEKMGTGSINPLARLGFTETVHDEEKNKWTSAINTICNAAVSLSKTKTGALMVIERKSKLGQVISMGGTILDAEPSVELIGNLFFENSPLHDGAVVIRDAKVYAAGCFLPLPETSANIPKSLGSRHRAALGMSESSDAIVIIISEETGIISTAVNGYLTRSYTKESLFEYLCGEIIPEQKNEEKNTKSIWKRVLRK